MRNVFSLATRSVGVTGEVFLSLIERRLDNVIYRIGFSASRKEARQLVKHKHFTINGKKVNVPSMRVHQGDIIEVAQKSRGLTKLTGALELYSMREIPAWINFEKNLLRATVKDLPKRDDITSKVEERLVVELYSK